ncbi:hydroxylysine kinase [Chrysoperla carnea]|uniref:hydroxylysine kinase n=1 Tax=Chrysoperla carnea TaxID=189513 RepID=UPI001D068FBA|nr:hydroxylysine kinase [Chrysoperla carnea]
MSSNKKETKSAIEYKPKLTNEDACEIVKNLYGVNCVNISELKAYDDKNYKINVENIINNKFIENICLDGYVLKIMNSLESKDIAFVEAQNRVMLYLAQNGIICPIPIKNVHGKYYSVEKISNNYHVVRMLEFVSGTIFCDVEITDYLFYCIGEYVAKLDQLLKNFSVDGIDTHTSIWHMICVPKLKEYYYCIKNDKHLNLINEIVDAFEQNVQPNLHLLDKGVIHGDFNEQNIVVEKNLKNYWIIKGVLDFGDMNVAYYLFELAITIAYAIIHSKSIDMGGLVMAGYLAVRDVFEFEINLLKTCIAARIAQSLVLGAFAHEKDPSNMYVLTTQEHGWNMLELLWKIPNEDLLYKWRVIGSNFSLPKDWK